ncbi:hypothetical protein PlfCFBP13513_06825 [Plantibacter flavus]|uniref:hypothetical protein n=1 Tax=Plantibacter flavus TaxID=150123 RepID=UPI0010C22B55|nr:hypothetical protein [Plantibacter flavus]TKJ99113.1 hypothetical protein PlfCFBP13513_06825 [Plantibacter flavus]
MSGTMQVDDAGLAAVVQAVAGAASSATGIFSTCLDTSFLDEQVATSAAAFELTWRTEITEAGKTLDDFARWMQNVADTMAGTDAALAEDAS